MVAPVYLRTGPFLFEVATACEEVVGSIELLYDPRCILPRRPDFCDYHVEVARPWLRRWFRPQAVFTFDGHAPFLPGPKRHAAAILEWGMNWVISTTAHQYLVIHAAVVERNGLAMLLPAPPGSGKSTLCAGLSFRGWRLLTDELALVRPDTGDVVPLARPISLKNETIELIRRFAPDAVMGAPTEGSSKGTIVLVKPPASSIDAIDRPARPRWIVFPRYEAGAALTYTPRSKAATFIQLGDSAMNYNILGETGFDTMADLIDRCDIGDFAYSDLDEAVAFFTKLADDAVRAPAVPAPMAAGR
ncbi:MAG: HprK-related kinase A [Alphaproteobacteria bacterium]|nr:HprK-related kinase A [Alphaproteobacteria bacterium]